MEHHEYDELKDRIERLEASVGNATGTLEDFMGSFIEQLEKQKELLKDVEFLRRYAGNARYEVADPRVIKYKYPKFFSYEETIRLIREEGASLARFGDGEFALMQGIQRYGFQRADERLAKRLREVVCSNEEGMLIGIADNFGDLSRYNWEAQAGIRRYMKENVRAFLDQIIDENKTYVDAYLTRFYVIYADNKGSGPAERLEMLRSMWEGRDVLIVEGALSRLGVGNDLFMNVNSLRRILVPTHNVFDRYDDILCGIRKEVNKGELVLLAAGPSAGIFAYDLRGDGIQALDVGHVDIEYEWFLKGQGKRCPVPGKFIGEVAGGEEVEDIMNLQYEREIVRDYSK